MSGNRAEVIFGVRLARHLSVYVIGSLLVLAISFVNVIVLTRLLRPAEFGALSLLIFWASLLMLLFNLSSMQGTLRSVFGSTGDDDVEDDEEEVDPDEVKELMGTGLLTTLLVSIAGLALLWPLSSPLAGIVVGDSDHGSWIMLAGAAGAFGALLRLSSNVLRFERRPVAFVISNALRPILILGPVVLLVAFHDRGVGGAIAGTAIGTGLAFLMVLVFTRRNYRFVFTRADAKRIYRKGAPIVPVVISLWVVQNVDVFILSRYVPHSDVAPYRVAAQFGLAVTYSTHAFFRAWQPLKRTTSFAALTNRVGEDALRGAMVTYFTLMSLVMLIGLTVAAETFALVAPADYDNLALLIPLVSGGFFMHGMLVVTYRASQFPKKPRYYAGASLLSAGAFFGAAVVLIPWLGTVGAALAVIFGFFVGTGVMYAVSQRGKRPIPFQYRNLVGGLALATLCIVGGRAIDAPAGRYQVLAGGAMVLAFAALALATGVVPRGHQAPLANVLRSLARLRAGDIDPEVALATLDPVDREILRLAVVHRRTPAQIAEHTGRELDDVHEHLVSALRKLAAQTEATEHDSRIGHYLFYRDSIAQQDALRHKLWSAGAEPDDVRELETTLEVLDRAPRGAWKPPVSPGAGR